MTRKQVKLVILLLRNNNNTTCETTAVLSFAVNSRPIINTQGMDEVICTDDLNSAVVLNAGLVDENTINDFPKKYSYFSSCSQMTKKWSDGEKYVIFRENRWSVF